MEPASECEQTADKRRDPRVAGLILAGGQARRMQDEGARNAHIWLYHGQTQSVKPDTERLASSLTGAGIARKQGNAAGQLDKGLLPLLDRPLIAWASAYLAGQVNDELFISANQNQPFYAQYGKVVDDRPEYRGAGPLAGIASVLEQLEKHDWLLVVPVDVPLLPPDLFSCFWRFVCSPPDDNMAADAPGLHRASTSGAGVDWPRPIRAVYAATAQRAHPLCLLVHRSALPDLRTYLHEGGRKVRIWLDEIGAAAVRFPEDGRSFFNINTGDELEKAETLLRADASSG